MSILITDGGMAKHTNVVRFS